MAMRAFIRTYLVVLAFAICAARADWPMAAHDPPRTNSASDAFTGPFTYRWTQFFDEKITRAQVIVAGGRALVGTLHGMGFQETWPVCTMDIVLFTSRAYSYGGASLPIQRTIARHAPNPTEEQSIALQDAIIRDIRENPSIRQTFFALDIETGKEAFTPPFAYNTGRQGPPTPPCVAPVFRPRSPGHPACAPAKPAPPICASSASRATRGHTSGSPISRPPGGIRSWRSSNRAGSKMRPCASPLCGRGRIRSDGGTRARAM